MQKIPLNPTDSPVDPARTEAHQVSCILVSYNSKDMLPEALNPLGPESDSDAIDCLVVDNNSVDGTIEMLRIRYPWVRLIESHANLGFGRGCNLGIAETSAPYILLLNPDACIDWEDINTLVRFMQANPKAGIVGPSVLNKDGAPQWAGGLPTAKSIIAGNLMPSRIMRRRIRVAPGDPTVQTDYISGSVMLIRRAMLEEIGSFDSRFFLYFEETDLCRRAMSGGWEIWVHGGAKARHQAAACAAQESEILYQDCLPDHYFRSRFYYLVKHEGWMLSTLAELVDYTMSLVRLSFRWLLRRPLGQLPIRLRAPMLSFPVFPDAPATPV